MMAPIWVPPSLTALRAFEIAARVLSFTDAAEELNPDARCDQPSGEPA